MYEQYFGLRERPFELSPNPRFLFLSAGHREALMHLRYGLTGRPGLTLLLGEAGTGKTTLVRAALQSRSSGDAKIVHLSNPTLTRSEFYDYLASEFEFTAEAAVSKTAFLRELQGAISAAGRDSRALALLVDEAQSLPHELLEEIRLLTNVEGAEGRSLLVALIGQPELRTRLNDVKLRQLKQRVGLRCELPPLNLRETAGYIASRIRVAGGSAETIFTREAVVAIHEHSRGIPRTISVICDNVLVNSFAGDVKPVGREGVLEVCRDFEFAAATPSAHQAPLAAARSAVAGAPQAGAGAMPVSVEKPSLPSRTLRGAAALNVGSQAEPVVPPAPPRAEAPPSAAPDGTREEPETRGSLVSIFNRLRRFSLF
jgi:general secretion pathway protein A